MNSISVPLCVEWSPIHSLFFFLIKPFTLFLTASVSNLVELIIASCLIKDEDLICDSVVLTLWLSIRWIPCAGTILFLYKIFITVCCSLLWLLCFIFSEQQWNKDINKSIIIYIDEIIYFDQKKKMRLYTSIISEK